MARVGSGGLALQDCPGDDLHRQADQPPPPHGPYGSFTVSRPRTSRDELPTRSSNWPDSVIQS